MIDYTAELERLPHEDDCSLGSYLEEKQAAKILGVRPHESIYPSGRMPDCDCNRAKVIEHFAAMEDKCERLKLEAQGHAQEARTANASLYECYQSVSGATGERGNWRGAEPVRKHIAAMENLFNASVEAQHTLQRRIGELATQIQQSDDIVQKARALCVELARHELNDFSGDHEAQIEAEEALRAACFPDAMEARKALEPSE